MIRIAFYLESWGQGGIETFVMNTVRFLDPQRFHFDIFCVHDRYDGYDAEIRALGGTRVTLFKGFRPGLVRRTLSGLTAWSDFLSKGHYDIAHINTMNGVGFAYAYVASNNGVPVRIVHSHNTKFGSGNRLAKTVVHNAGKELFSKYATDNLACSADAGRYLFDEDPCMVPPNAINIDEYRYSPESRSRVRDGLGVSESTLLFGNIGRINNIKNSTYQLRVLETLIKHGVDAKLLFVGSGELVEEIRRQSHDLEMADRLLIQKPTQDVCPYYNALDVFSLPSLYEGMPFSAIEAQASGLPCVYSTNVPKEIDITDTGRFLEISDDVEEWAKAIVRAYGKGRFNDNPRLLEERGYSAEANAELLMQHYEKLMGRA